MHHDIQPAILYFGTPVVLVSTLNHDGSVNVAPISSIWWLGWSAMIGIDASSKTTENIIRTGECVLNMPSIEQAPQTDKLAKTTGQINIPLHKKALGYRYANDKLAVSGLTSTASLMVSAPRLHECPVQLEAKLRNISEFGKGNPKMGIPSAAIELDILKVHAAEQILMENSTSHIDPDKWHPLIMSFRKFYSTGGTVHK
jgi:flavin reductase (DIM6/NTAB) family NADH-FMN oxidoreductase RutF